MANRSFSVVISDNSAKIKHRLERITINIPNIKIIGQVRNSASSGKNMMETPDVVIHEIKVPSEKNIEFIKKVKKLFPSTIVIIITDITDSLYKATCYASGADYFFDKPEKYQLTANVLSKLANGYIPLYFN